MEYMVHDKNSIKMSYVRRLFLFINLCLFLTLKGHPVRGQSGNSTFSAPICDNKCPVGKRCLQGNVTIVWDYVNGENYLCETYKTCYGSSSDYVENTLAGFFPVRLKPVDIARGSSVYFVSKGIAGMSFRFRVYNVSRGHFFNCSKAGGEEVSAGLMTSLKVPSRFLSSLGYKFFIASGNVFYSCNFGLRLHMNVKDATNCTGFSTLPSGARLCSGKGRCMSDSFTAGMSCECCHGYTGPYCEEFDACSAAPCYRGNCTDITAGHLNHFYCLCPKGYTGRACELDIDDCVSQPCKNGALCVDGLNKYTCLCPSTELHGTHCEFFSNQCEIYKPCQNNGNCSRVGVLKQSYVCHCAPGFSGRNCTLNATVSIDTPTKNLSTMMLTSSHDLISNLPTSVVHSVFVKSQFTSTQTFISVIQTLVGSVTLPSVTSDLAQILTSEKSSSVLDSKLKTSRYTSLFSLPVSLIIKTSEISQSSVTLESDLKSRNTPVSSMTVGLSFEATQYQSTPTSLSSVEKPITSQRVETSISRNIPIDGQSSTIVAESSGQDFAKTVSMTIAERTTDILPAMSSVWSPPLTNSVASNNLVSSSKTSLLEFTSLTITDKVSQTLIPSKSLFLQSSKAQESSQVVSTIELKSSKPPQASATIVSSSVPLGASSLSLPVVFEGSKTTVMVPASSTLFQSSAVVPSMLPTPTIPSASSVNSIVVTPPMPFSSEQPSLISPSASASATLRTPSSTVLPTTRPPLENQTCADTPCGVHGVCTNRATSESELLFYCDCKYPTVGPICTTDLELHFPLFNGKSYIKHKPIIFGSSLNEFVISFRTKIDGTILYSGHTSYRDFIKLEVLGGKLRFSVDAGDKVVAVTSSEIVTNGNTTAAIVGYDTRAGTVSMTVNNGPVLSQTTSGKLRAVQLYQYLYIGGNIPSIFTSNKPGIGVITPFVGCIRELEFNDRAILLSDALDWQNISECDLPACRALPCKNGGACVGDLGDVSEYLCQCPYPYSGKNCGKKYACLVNVCNGGVCLNTTSGPQCLCPFGKGGVSCNQDLFVNIPSFTVTHDHSSFLQYHTPKGAVNHLDIRLEIKLSNDPRARNSALLFYVGLHDHLSVGSDGDYLALGILNNHVLLQYNLGSGAANITSQRQLTIDQEWFTILAGRNGRDGYLYIDNKDIQEGHSPSPLVALNVFGHMYLGGIPEVSQLNSEVVFKEGFRGTIKDPKIRTGSSNSWFPMSMKHSLNNSNELIVVTGLNIQNERVNACVVGACLNNGSCESLGASYVCQCPPVWSGMVCNDTSIPCREYNPCQGRSTCRTRDLGLTCDCSPGKAGKYCQNDINITKPLFLEYSYMSFSLDKINVQSKTSLSIGFSPSKDDGILFYITRDIKSLSGDFKSITLHDRYVYLIYNLGTGLAKCKSQNTVRLNQRNDVIVTRDLKVSSLVLNGNQTSCTSQGPAVGLNVQSVFYLGGVPDLAQVQAMAYENTKDLRDYTGCVDHLTINGQSFDLTEQGPRNGRNILNCDSSLLQA